MLRKMENEPKRMEASYQSELNGPEALPSIPAPDDTRDGRDPTLPPPPPYHTSIATVEDIQAEEGFFNDDTGEGASDVPALRKSPASRP